MTDYLSGVWRCRYFWMALARMDLRTRYRRSVLGLGWSLVHPLAMTTILCVVFLAWMFAGASPGQDEVAGVPQGFPVRLQKQS